MIKCLNGWKDRSTVAVEKWMHVQMVDIKKMSDIKWMNGRSFMKCSHLKVCKWLTDRYEWMGTFEKWLDGQMDAGWSGRRWDGEGLNVRLDGLWRTDGTMDECWAKEINGWLTDGWWMLEYTVCLAKWTDGGWTYRWWSTEKSFGKRERMQGLTLFPFELFQSWPFCFSATEKMFLNKEKIFFSCLQKARQINTQKVESTTRRESWFNESPERR